VFAPERHCGQPSGRAWNCAFRDCLPIFSFLQPKLPQITQSWPAKIKTEPRIRDRANEVMDYRSAAEIIPLLHQSIASRASHVGASARVDLDRLAFFDEQWDVDDLAGLECRWLGHIARCVAAQSLCGFGHFEAH
jgi:hypothetical protein